jgi:hypothetical protein
MTSTIVTATQSRRHKMEPHYRRYGRVMGKLTPWVMRLECACGFESDWFPQPASQLLVEIGLLHEEGLLA